MGARTKVFISYSREDYQWLKRLQVHLKPLRRDRVVDAWDDTRIRAGDDWMKVIESELASAQVAVLLVSADFLASDFIASDELPTILKAEEQRGLIVIPVIVEPCRFRQTKTLSRFQARNPPERPLAGMKKVERDRLWVKLTEEIEAAGESAEAARQQPVRRNPDRNVGREQSLAPARPTGAIQVSQATDQALHIFDPELSLSVSVADRIEIADGLKQAGDPRLDPWVLVPAGRFLMGAQKMDPSAPNYDPEANDDAAPVHTVHLGAYRVGRYPVTVRDFERFVEAEGYKDRRWWQAGGFKQYEQPRPWQEQLSHPNRPVVGVSWFEAMAYCQWAGYRLPTEAEWERAARGTEGRPFPWGSEPPEPERLNYNRNVGHPTPVGLYPLGATPDGIHDIAGNVWEWCQDWYAPDYYALSLSINPPGPGSGGRRVLRGCSWTNGAGFARSTFRNRGWPEYRIDLIGFRVVVGGGARTSGA
jgi:formylglycine-generating enzyme required for sulfatase activity